jgi:tRNA(Ile)-lysidine synthase
VLLSRLQRSLHDAGVTVPAESRVLVACSAGADSAALAYAAVEVLGARRVVLGHVDHAVRPDSIEDAAWVQRFGERLGAEVEVSRLAAGPDDEARLREERYAQLEAQRQKRGCALILTAHTADDQAETVLIALLRSTEPEALAGMPERRGVIVRPWLDVSRSEVRAYAARHRLDWREDPSNLEPRYLRNRVRKELLPLIERRYRPGFARRLARTVAAPEAVHRTVAPSPPRANATSGAIRVERRGWEGGPLPAGPASAVFDAALLPAPIVRPVAPGDRIRPLGMEGRRKLQDVFVDAKIPREARTWVWVVAKPDGEVAWVPGLLRSADAPVGPDTKEVWIFSLELGLTCGSGSEGSL